MTKFRDLLHALSMTKFKDLLQALSHRHDNTWTAFGEPVVGTGGDKSIACLKNSTFLKQTGRAVLEPGRPT